MKLHAHLSCNVHIHTLNKYNLCLVTAGVLFRCYPGPWQVMRRHAEDDLRVVHTQESMPTLKQVAIEILPNA